MNNLALRIISAVILTLVCIGGIVWHPLSRWLVFAFFIVGGSYEYSLMLAKKFFPEGPRWKNFLLPFVVLMLVLPYLPVVRLSDLGSQIYNQFFYLFFGLIGVLCAFKWAVLSNIAPWIFMQGAGLGFFGFWVPALFQLSAKEVGWASSGPFIWTAFCMITADTGGYFAGKYLGKHKLCPEISPKKTIEGLVGGFVATLALCLWVGPFFLNWGILPSVIFGIVMTTTAVVGDLLISSLKRYVDVKDASKLIPGHGGVLDRFDSLFFSAPFALLIFKLVA